MKMTYKLATRLMDDLFCLAISANGGYSENIPIEALELFQKYAKDRFQNLCEEWEGVMGKEWNISEPNEAV